MKAAERTILIVDDDADIRTTVAEILRDEGYQVTTAGNGREALELLTAKDAALPNLILLDMMMPIMDGTAFRREQVKNRALASIPVITFTAFGSMSDMSWAAGHLPKPLRLNMLLGIVAKHAR